LSQNLIEPSYQINVDSRRKQSQPEITKPSKS
jgi:hypothetical protein